MSLFKNIYDYEENKSTGYRNRIFLKLLVLTILFAVASTKVKIERVLNFVGSLGSAFTIFVVPTYVYLLG
jgi:hypothetical protein